MLAILFCVVSLYRLGSWGVIDTSEARYADIARQMYEQGDYAHPLYLGVHHYHKPPLTYYISTAGYHLFGASAFGARIVLHFALLLQFCLIWLIARDWYHDKSKALNAVLLYASFFIVWIGTRNLTTDLYLCTFLLAAIWALSRYAHLGKSVYLYMSALVGGLAFLTKFTASLVILGPMALVIWWTNRQTWRWSWHFLPGLLLYVGVSLSWFFVLEAEGKPILKYLLYDHSVVRYTTDTFSRNEPFYMYLIAAPLLAFPWLLMTVQVVVQQWRKAILTSRTALTFAIWTVFPILFYSLSHSKLILYILPAFPAVAILGAHMVEQLSPVALRRWLRIQAGVIVLVLIALHVYPLFTQYAQPSALQYVLTEILVVGIAWVYFRQNLATIRKMAMISAIFTMGLVMISTHILSDNAQDISTTKPVAEWIKSEGLEVRNILVFDRLAPSLSFHLKKRVGTITLEEKRELQFETDDHWQTQYFNLERFEDVERLGTVLSKPSVIVARRKAEIPEHLVAHFGSMEEIGKWRVYY